MKPKDYEAAAEVEAESEYAAWGLLRISGQALNVGDLLESPGGELRICKYVGFEEARWLLPEVKLPESPHPGFVPSPAPANQSAQI